MLNIGKLAAGSHEYYLASVAAGTEDYYLAHGEPQGYWLARAGTDLDLDGAVTREALRAVLGARHPSTGAPLLAQTQRTVPGFDLTFLAPKSVSVLYGLSDRHVAGEVQAAHDTAVEAALRYLENHAAWSRRGAGGAEQVRSNGFVAAAFRHRTSRAADPLIHTHVLVANLARASDDGRWRTLDGRHLYTHARTAGFLYQAQLRAELTRRLGVEWEPVVNGCADIAGIPRQLVEAFSTRRHAIEAHMAERGESSAKAAQVATLATRRAKDHQVDVGGLRQRWRATASELGFGAAQLAAVIGRTVAVTPSGKELLAIAEALCGEEGLTAQASSFTRRDVLRAWAERLPGGADVQRIEQLADVLLDGNGRVVALDFAQRLAARDVIRRGDGAVIPADKGERRYSTPELLALERHGLELADRQVEAGIAVVDAARLKQALARRPTLGEDQARMVRHLTFSGSGVEVVVGKAGAGKTYALEAARDTWQSSGHRVIGAALSARAAAELEAGTGIDSSTIHSLLADLARPDRVGSRLAPGSVLVVDEAGMVGTRQLVGILDHAAAAGAKVVLVGDHHQLPEIDAGGLFRALARRLPGVELTENRCQSEAWEAAALDELRHGDPATAVVRYEKQERLVFADTAEAAREKLVSDWWAAYQAAFSEPGVMIALRRSDVADLNTRARQRLSAAGVLTGASLDVDGREFRAGDRVVCLRNERRLGVTNGTRGMVTAIDRHDRTVTVRRDGADEPVVLPAAYLDAGNLDHGYALTAHKAQGLTVNATWVLGSDAIYREWGYVALSRGRDANRLYLVQTQGEWNEAHTPPARDERDPRQALVQRLGRSRTDTLGVEQLGAARQHTLERLGERRRELQQAMEEMTQAVAEAEERVDRLAASRPWQRSKRGELVEARRAAERYRADLATAEQSLAEIDKRLATIPTLEQLHDRISRGRGMTGERSRSRQREQEPPSLGLGL